jgi:hypothetical protein
MTKGLTEKFIKDHNIDWVDASSTQEEFLI